MHYTITSMITDLFSIFDKPLQNGLQVSASTEKFNSQQRFCLESSRWSVLGLRVKIILSVSFLSFQGPKGRQSISLANETCLPIK